MEAIHCTHPSVTSFLRGHRDRMNSIGNSPQLDRAGLQSLADRLTLDDTGRHAGQLPTSTPAIGELTGVAEDSGSSRLSDPGEQMLAIAGWDGVPSGQRMLTHDAVLQGALSRLDLASAVDAGVDAVVAALR